MLHCQFFSRWGDRTMNLWPRSNSPLGVNSDSNKGRKGLQFLFIQLGIQFCLPSLHCWSSSSGWLPPLHLAQGTSFKGVSFDTGSVPKDLPAWWPEGIDKSYVRWYVRVLRSKVVHSVTISGFSTYVYSEIVSEMWVPPDSHWHWEGSMT